MKKLIFSALALSWAICASATTTQKFNYDGFNVHIYTSQEVIEANLAELIKAQESLCEVFVGSHGSVASAEDVKFRIEYLKKMRSLLAKCKDSDSFSQQMLTAYPSIPGAENMREIAKALYPNETPSKEKEEVRSRVQDYLNMVSNLDKDIAEGLWAKSDNISIITPRSQFVGANSIMNDFLIKTFSKMKYRKLSSLSEVINIYGDSANVQLYWVFDTIDAKGEAHQTRGRESLIFSKIDGVWRLVHVHYSRMPQ